MSRLGELMQELCPEGGIIERKSLSVDEIKQYMDVMKSKGRYIANASAGIVEKQETLQEITP